MNEGLRYDKSRRSNRYINQSACHDLRSQFGRAGPRSQGRFESIAFKSPQICSLHRRYVPGSDVFALDGTLYSECNDTYGFQESRLKIPPLNDTSLELATSRRSYSPIPSRSNDNKAILIKKVSPVEYGGEIPDDQVGPNVGIRNPRN